MVNVVFVRTVAWTQIDKGSLQWSLMTHCTLLELPGTSGRSSIGEWQFKVTVTMHNTPLMCNKPHELLKEQAQKQYKAVDYW